MCISLLLEKRRKTNTDSAISLKQICKDFDNYQQMFKSNCIVYNIYHWTHMFCLQLIVLLIKKLC